jgi:hypothetical protein
MATRTTKARAWRHRTLLALQPLLQAFTQHGAQPKLKRQSTREHGHSQQIQFDPVSQQVKPQREINANAAQGYWMRSVRSTWRNQR